ncbi:hypothetical protein [Streptomyces sp. IBSBF 3010]|uniref:hypothetical protein n=1 Tax=Streptomyces sp. IBSBF 3010 TaxID=2903526 RepID=UPI002FDBD4DF
MWAEIAIDAEWSNEGRDASVSSPGLFESDGLRTPEVARADPNLIGRVLVGIKDL